MNETRLEVVVAQVEQTGVWCWHVFRTRENGRRGVELATGFAGTQERAFEHAGAGLVSLARGLVWNAGEGGAR